MSNENSGSLLSEALQAPDDVSEMSNSEGRIVRIQRDPSYPGAKRAHLDAPLPDDRVTQVWRLPASATRPEFYPSDVPFIPDVSCLVTEGKRGLSVSWKDAASRSLSPEKAEAIRTSAPADLSDLMSSVYRRSPDKPAPADAAELHRLFRERFRDDDVQQWVVSDSGRELEDRIVARFDDLVRQSVESGWSQEGPGEGDPPFVIRSETLRKAGTQRELTLMAVAGISNIILRDETIEPVASRHES